MDEKEMPLRLTALEIQNILRIKAVRLTMGDDALIIEGANEAGKSSVLTSLEIVLAGMSCTPDEPIHGDKKKGKIVATFGDLTVTKQFTRGKRPTLTIQSGSKKYSSPQKMLESFLDFVALRPLRFLEYDAAKQLKVLSELMGLDTTALDDEERAAYDERRDTNREVKRLKVAYESIPEYTDAPEEEVKITELMQELEKVQGYNKSGEKLDIELNRVMQATHAARTRKTELEKELGDLDKELLELDIDYEQVQLRLNAYKVKDESPLREKIAKADEINTMVRDNVRKANAYNDWQQAEQTAMELTDRLADVQRKKTETREEAAEQLPVPELDLKEDGVFYKGKPLAQAGSSAQFRVSVAVAMALNEDKRIKLLLLDEAQKLDPSNTKAILEMAAEKGFQVLLARVGDGREASVVIEDGEVKEVE